MVNTDECRRQYLRRRSNFMDLRETYTTLRDLGAVASMDEFDARWLAQRPGYTCRGGAAAPRRAGLPALIRLAARLDRLAASKTVPSLRALRSALAEEILNRVAGDGRR
jgi:hypothetical protein